MGSPRQDAVSETPLLQQQEEEEVFRDDGLGVDGPHQATQVPEGESGKSGQNIAPQDTRGARKWICVQFCHILNVDLRKAHISPKSSNPPLWPFPFVLEPKPLLTKLYPFHTELHPIPPPLSLILLTKPYPSESYPSD